MNNNLNKSFCETSDDEYTLKSPFDIIDLNDVKEPVSPTLATKQSCMTKTVIEESDFKFTTPQSKPNNIKINRPIKNKFNGIIEDEPYDNINNIIDNHNLMNDVNYSLNNIILERPLLKRQVNNISLSNIPDEKKK